MVEIVPYRPEYRFLLEEMLKTNKNSQIKPEYLDPLPKIGFIAFAAHQPLASGFLRMVEGGFGQIDTLISNAGFPSQIRHQAVSAIVDILIEKAKENNLKAIYAHTKEKSIIERASKLGFFLVPEAIIALPLVDVLTSRQ